MPLALLLILSAVVYRLLPHPWNLAPVGALALLGGLYLGKRTALFVPLVALLVSDWFLNLRFGYSSWYWPRLVDYAAFLSIGAMGLWCRDRSPIAKGGAAFATPFLFFLLSNFGVWLFGLSLSGAPYAKTFGGLAECYLAALPFLRGTLIGDWGFLLLFAAVLCAVRQWAGPGRTWLTAPVHA